MCIKGLKKVQKMFMAKVDFLVIESMHGCHSNQNMLSNSATNQGSQNGLNLFVVELRPQHIPGKQIGQR